MKVILTGATGWIGSGVLKRCLALPSITSIVALTRRTMDVQDAKLENIVHSDFKQYDDATIQKLKGAEACIWCVFCPLLTSLVEHF